MIEIVVALSIVAMLAGVAIPAFLDSARGDLRGSSRRLSGLIRSTYAEAILNGDTRRLLFTPRTGTVVMEASEGLIRLDPEKPVLVGDGDDEDEDDDAVVSGGGSLGDLLSPGAALPARGRFQEAGVRLELPEGVMIRDVWLEGLDEAVADGPVHLYFFRHGYTQNAIIVLSDEDGVEYSLRVRSLTGRTEIHAGRFDWKTL